MKPGVTTRSTEKPEAGFIFAREGYSIYISYIDPVTVTTVFVPDDNMNEESSEMSGHTEYEYKFYSYTGAITTYEELVNNCILLKYPIEDEMALTSKAIANPEDKEYLAYREFVELCKSESKANYESLGLVRNDV